MKAEKEKYFFPDFKCNSHNDEYQFTSTEDCVTTHVSEPILAPMPAHLPGTGRRATLGTNLRENLKC